MADSQGSRRGISSLSGNLAAALVAAAISIPSAVLSHGIAGPRTAPRHAAFTQSQLNVAVPAEKEWTSTGIALLPGDSLGVRGGGGWTNVKGGNPVGQRGYGTLFPGTILADAPLAALIARIGDSVFQPTVEPSAVKFRGVLLLGMNDVRGTFNDNQGALQTLVRYIHTPARVPDFIGKPEADATQFFGQYQFVPAITRGGSSLATGLIYQQDPKDGADLHGVTDVRLFVSTGPVAPPPPVRESTRQDPQGRTSGTKGSASVSGGRDTWWLRTGGVIAGGIVALMILARLIKGGRKSPDKASVSPVPVHFDPAIEAEPVTPPRNLTMPGPSVHLQVDLEPGATRTAALVILRKETLND